MPVGMLGCASYGECEFSDVQVCVITHTDMTHSYRISPLYRHVFGEISIISTAEKNS